LSEKPATGIDCARSPNAWSGIGAIFTHVPPDLRRTVHQRVVDGLLPGGVVILQA
jgi:hypothetical protein